LFSDIVGSNIYYDMNVVWCKPVYSAHFVEPNGYIHFVKFLFGVFILQHQLQNFKTSDDSNTVLNYFISELHFIQILIYTPEV